jgi:hypothetical protein
MSVKDICFSTYSISVFMAIYNLFSHEKDRSKAVSHSETVFFFFVISGWELRRLSSEETCLVKIG